MTDEIIIKQDGKVFQATPTRIKHSNWDYTRNQAKKLVDSLRPYLKDEMVLDGGGSLAGEFDLVKLLDVTYRKSGFKSDKPNRFEVQAKVKVIEEYRSFSDPKNIGKIQEPFLASWGLCYLKEVTEKTYKPFKDVFVQRIIERVKK